MRARRTLAYLVDSLLTVPGYWPALNGTPKREGDAEGKASRLVAAGFVASPTVVFALCTAVTRAGSPGKLALGLRVVPLAGANKVAPWQALVREGLTPAAMAVVQVRSTSRVGASTIWAADLAIKTVRRDGRGLGDLVPRTKVTER
jgi:uncharacterized RDD family membrane protein YckC